MTVFNWLTNVCWLVFVVYWGISAFGAKRNARSVWRGLAVRLAIIAVLFASFRTHAFRQLSAQMPVAASHPVIGGIGVLLCALGVATAIWARRNLGKNWGMPMAVKEAPDLITSGPYAYVRHPIYSGMLLALLGSSLVMGVWMLALMVVLGAYFVFSARTEEQTMLREFPTQYPDYMRRTKMLIPFVF
jgi:protein-S-isoprenylcysteine O-methyltransferase Ste14